MRSRETCASAGGRTGATRPTRARARSDHSKTSAGSPSSSASTRPRVARSRPCPTRVLWRSRLPNEDCQVCRSLSPARTCCRALRPSPRARARSARTSRHSSRVVTGERAPTRTQRSRVRASARSPRATLTRAPCSSRTVASWVRPCRRSSATSESARSSTERAVAPAEISATRAAESARTAHTGLACPRKWRAARRATTRARTGSSRSNVQARVSSHSAWKVRSRREP